EAILVSIILIILLMVTVASIFYFFNFTLSGLSAGRVILERKNISYSPTNLDNSTIGGVGRVNSED
ncbi:MAG: hypothetical protein QXJ28_01575, partial [Candidatus Pacearchaeota archaeon]